MTSTFGNGPSDCVRSIEASPPATGACTAIPVASFSRSSRDFSLADAERREISM
jgi:hypothetical protein